MAPLVFAETVAILGLTQRHGSAVLKTYGLGTHHSVSVLALWSMCFRRVRRGGGFALADWQRGSLSSRASRRGHLSLCLLAARLQIAVVKPLMSRGGNSEVYLLGFDFRGTRSPLLLAASKAVQDFNPTRAVVPREWLPQVGLQKKRNSAFTGARMRGSRRGLC